MSSAAWVKHRAVFAGYVNADAAVDGIDSVSSLCRFTYQDRLVRTISRRWGRGFCEGEARRKIAPDVRRYRRERGNGRALWPGREAWDNACGSLANGARARYDADAERATGVAENAVHNPIADFSFDTTLTRSSISDRDRSCCGCAAILRVVAEDSSRAAGGDARSITGDGRTGAMRSTRSVDRGLLEQRCSSPSACFAVGCRGRSLWGDRVRRRTTDARAAYVSRSARSQGT